MLAAEAKIWRDYSKPESKHVKNQFETNEATVAAALNFEYKEKSCHSGFLLNTHAHFNTEGEQWVNC